MTANLDGSFSATQDLSKWNLKTNPKVSSLPSLLKRTTTEDIAEEITEMTKDIVEVRPRRLDPTLDALVPIPIVQFPLFAVAKDFIGFAGFTKDLCCTRIVGILIRVVCEGDAPEGFFYLQSVIV